jgi:aminopeptidase N
MTASVLDVNRVPTVVYRHDYQPPAYDIDEVHLHFDLYDHEAVVRSRLLVRRRQGFSTSELFLNGEDLTLVSLSMDGEVLAPEAYTLTPQGLSLRDLPAVCELIIITKIHPEKNTALSGLYRSGKTFCTQCEAEGFRRITYFPDHPDVLSRFTTTIEADLAQYPILLSNGNPVQQGITQEARHWVKWEDPFKKPSYLFALVAGDFDLREEVFTTCSGRKVALRVYVEKGMGDQSAHAMTSLKMAMRWDEQAYGREYDLDIFMIVAIADFNMGAMENKGLNIFNTKYVLAKPATATDDDYNNILSVVAHEYFHNWTGNRITCRDWFQLSLKEGLTIFRDQSFSEDVVSRSVMRIRDVIDLRESQFPEDAGPLSHPVRPESYMEIDNFYTATIYNKGAEVLRMLQTIVGREVFRQGMDAYFDTFDGQAVTIDDFVNTMEMVSGRNLTQFRRWYSQSGTPMVAVKESYDEKEKVYRLQFSQRTLPTQDQADKHALFIPIRMGLWLKDANVCPLYLDDQSVGNETVLHLINEEQTFEFQQVPSHPIPSLLRGFSAPVKLEFECSDADKLFLMAFDTDAFNRFEAMQQLAVSTTLRLVKAYRQNETLTLPAAWADTLSQLLADENQDPYLLAELLTLPSEKFIGDQMAVVDVEAIHVAREFIMQRLATALKSRFLALYDTLTEKTKGLDFDVSVLGLRALKNRALTYLSYTSEGLSLANIQLTERLSVNMTDAQAALACLNRVEGPLRQPALDVFYTVWKHDALVLDKWFAMQATAPLPGTLDEVKFLTEHSDFDWKNPNKVYALIGAFGARNPLCFHHHSGAGYVFLREAVQKLDRLNPKVAARMVKPLTSWGRYDKERQAKLKHELMVLKATPSLSTDVYELVTKSLEAE